MASTDATEVWITPTKVCAPRLPRDTVARARLTARLLAGLSRPLTLVAAPAGFGKTTLLGTALAGSPWPVAWLFLDTDDRDLSAFLHALVAAVQAVFPDSCRSTQSLLRRPALPSPGEIARIVEHDLVDLGEELVLVLDDYHAVAAPEIDALLVALLRHVLPGLHLVVASRQTPDWPLARLRAAEDLAEIGPEDLSFTDDEARDFLTAVLGTSLGDETTSLITARMAGWAVGLRLSAVALRDSSRSPQTMADLEGRTQQYVVEYLLEEIVGREPPDVQRFLLRTIIADRDCAGLGDALVDWTDPNIIQELLASPLARDFDEHPAISLRLQVGLTAVYWASGDLAGAERTAQQVAAGARAHGFDVLEAWAHHDLGCIYYAQDDLAGAEQQFTAVIGLCHKANANAIARSRRALALIHHIRGQIPSSPRSVEMLAHDVSAGALDEGIGRAFEATLALMRGDLTAASDWLRGEQLTRGCIPIQPFVVPELTGIRVLIALGTDASLSEAHRLLADDLGYYSARHDTPRLIDVLALQAQAYAANGSEEQALDALEKALQLAAPGRFMRPFLDLGPPLARLLLELERRGRAGAHGRHVLAALGTQSHVAPLVVPGRESMSENLIEPLTARELEVLALVAARLRNKEVARALNISWQTVSKHTVNIYQKLQVADRREAVHRAQILGLIPTTDPLDQFPDTPVCVVPQFG